MKFERITIDGGQMAGVPCIRGLRIPVATVLSKLAANPNIDDLLAAYPDLEHADVTQALEFAAEVLTERQLPSVA